MYFPITHISIYSLAETFDVGYDLITQVDPAYEESPFNFTDELDKIIIRLPEYKQIK